MSQALRTHISILKLARGRRERHTPTARVVEPATGIAPARGKGNLYVLMELEGPARSRARIYREMLNTIQEGYYYHSGDAAESLTAALQAAHGYLREYNQYHATDFRAGATCLAATGSEIVLAQAGPTILAVRSAAGLQWYSPLNNEDYRSLGDDEPPTVEVARTEGEAGLVMVAMNSAWANYLDVRLTHEATAVPDAQAVADQMAGIGIDAEEELTLLVIALTESDEAPAPEMERPYRPESGMAAAPPQVEEAWSLEAGPEELDLGEAFGDMDQVAARGVRRKPKIELKRKPRAKKPKPARPKGPPRRIPYAVAILVTLILIVAAVTAVMWFMQGRQRADLFEQYLNGAQVNLDAAAREVDESQARIYLQAADEQLAQAALFFPDHPEVERMRILIDEMGAKVNRVQPMLTGFDTPLVNFDPGSESPTRVFVDGLSIYVLDPKAGTLARYQLDEATGDRLADDGAAEVLLRAGESVEGRTINELAHAVWAPAMGNRTATGPLALDRGNQLFGWVEGLGAVNVKMAENPDLGFVADMEYYFGNIYLLDKSGSELYRYRPSGESYTEPPESYFAAETRVNLSGVIDMAIDGSVWLLHPNGTVLKFFGGEQEAFALDVVDPPIGDAVSMWANEVDSPGGRLYIGDPAHNRVLVFDKQGKLLSQLTPAGRPNVLRSLRSIWVDEATDYLYALTETALYQAPLPAIGAEE
ncbi:MAG: hypothetical protein GXP42_03425 [Chloroflexi bacterium]|nr:hypothetical protein [Chloroflexota bacterium]